MERRQGAGAVVAGRTGGSRWAERAARVCDGVLDLGVVAFAAWTLIYHASLLLGLRSVWAAVAEALAFVAAVWFVARGRRAGAAAPLPGPQAAGRLRRRRRELLVATVVAAVAAAVLFGWGGDGAWTITWILWLVAGAGAMGLALSGGDAAQAAPDQAAARPGRGAAAALLWSVALAALSLFVVNPDTDDAQYVHVAGWIAAHGRFPLRDTIFTDQALPSLFYPPVSSFEALLGTFSRGIPVSLPDLVYLGVVPVASVLAVLALWRLLRAWGVAMVGVALSVAVIFLLFDAGQHWLPGSYFIGRDWQGKVVFVTVMIPLLFVLVQRHAERPSGRGLVLLAAAGVASVGLTTTAIFTVPILAVAGLAPSLRERRRPALAGMAAAIAYPLIAGVATLIVGGRNPDEYTDAGILPTFLAHRALGTEQFGAIALFAALAGAAAIPRRRGARAVAATLLAVGLLFIPGVTGLLFHSTGLGRVLWRLLWLLPVAPLLGALTVRALPRRLPAAARVLPAVAACVLMVVVGAPVWSQAAGGALAGRPSVKLWRVDATTAQAILARAPRDATVLAPHSASQALLALSGTVTVVDPLDRYARSLKQFYPHGAFALRLTLTNFTERGLDALTHPQIRRYVRTSLKTLHVDVACLRPGLPANDAVLAAAGWRRMAGVPNLVCRRAPGQAAPRSRQRSASSASH